MWILAHRDVIRELGEALRFLYEVSFLIQWKNIPKNN